MGGRADSEASIGERDNNAATAAWRKLKSGTKIHFNASLIVREQFIKSYHGSVTLRKIYI